MIQPSHSWRTPIVHVLDPACSFVAVAGSVAGATQPVSAASPGTVTKGQLSS
ncbi:MAG: hypothetical protein ABJA80_00330 [bacterium]